MNLIRTAPLLAIILVVSVITALLVVGQVWMHLYSWAVFTKMLITLGIAGTITAFYIAVDYDLPACKSRLLLLAAALFSTILAALIVTQLWWAPLSQPVFTKLVFTDLAFLALSAFALGALEDFNADKTLKDEKFVN